jgi:DHA2 family multidrug resistance protein
MMGNFGVNQSEVTWVATSYSIAEIIMVTMTGWWSMLIGRKRMLVASFAIFTLGSVLCGMAHTFPEMLVFRTIQGIGGGSLIPLSQAILRETFPKEQQGTAMAFYGMGVVLAPAVGPIFGGWLTDQYGWPWIFYINVPVSALGLVLISAFVHDPSYLRRGVAKIDWTGIFLLSVGLTVMQLVLERGEQENWFESHLILLGTAVCVVSIVGLIAWELYVEHPIINLRLLRNVPLSVGSAIGLVFGLALFGTTFILPQFTQELLGYNAYDAGLVLMPRAVMLFFFMPVAGRLYGKVDARILMFVGLGLIIWSYYGLARISLDAGFWTLVPILLIMGAGMPFMFVTMSTLALSDVKREDMTDASSLYTLARRVGGNLGYAVVATLAAHDTQFHRATLVEHVSRFNPAFHSYQAQVIDSLVNRGLTSEAAQHASYAIANTAINHQSTMLAYNDISYLFGLMFLLSAPLIFFLPSGKS